MRGNGFQSVLLGCSLLENEQVPNHTIGALGSKGVHRTNCVHSPDVDVIVAFVNPVTIVPMDEHKIFYVALLHNPYLDCTCQSFFSQFDNHMTN